LEPNEIVGEFPILLKTQATYAANVKAREQSAVAWVSEKDFEEVATANPDLWKGMSKMLVKRLIDSNKQRRKIELWATIVIAVLLTAMIALVVHSSFGVRG
jgi:CRP-like cAMP-binding protein